MLERLPYRVMALHGSVIVGGDIYIQMTFNSAPLASHDTMWERTMSPGDASASGSIAAAAAGAEPVVAPSGVATDSARTVPPQVPNPGYCANDGRAAAVRPRKRKLLRVRFHLRLPCGNAVSRSQLACA